MKTASGVVGIGVDIVEISRMQESLREWGKRFKDRVFLPNEQQYCDSKGEPSRHYAGRFAVKEAVSKAFGTGIGEHISWLDIEVLRDETTGAPSVKLSEKASQLAANRGVGDILVSLSHSHTFAVAQALLTSSPQD